MAVSSAAGAVLGLGGLYGPDPKLAFGVLLGQDLVSLVVAAPLLLGPMWVHEGLPDGKPVPDRHIPPARSIRSDTMKAKTRNRYGSAEVQWLDDIARPVVEDDAVLVRVHAAGVGPDVWHLMTGHRVTREP